MNTLFPTVLFVHSFWTYQGSTAASVWSFPEYTNTAGIWCFPSEIPSVWSIPEYTNTAGIWYSPLEYKVFGFCLNIRILRVFGAPRKYQLFGCLLVYTKTAGIWYFPFGNTNCLGMRRTNLLVQGLPVLGPGPASGGPGAEQIY